MKKFALVLVLAVLACSIGFAAGLNTIAVGANYSFVRSLEDDEMFFHGPGFAMSSMIGFGSSNAMLYMDMGVNFPLSIDSAVVKLDRDDFDMLLVLDATLGAGYISNPGKSSYFVGGGIHFSEIGTRRDNVASSLDLLFGIAAFGGYQFYFTDHLFLEASAKIGLSIYDWGKAETIFGKTGWQGNSSMGLTGVARVLFGYNF